LLWCLTLTLYSILLLLPSFPAAANKWWFYSNREG
jgi:hypothetical protein